MEGRKPKFPLPRGFFGDVRFSAALNDSYRELCHQQVQRGLHDEAAFFSAGSQIDRSKWKRVRSQRQFQLYRRRDGGASLSMMGVGRIEGSVEDVLYGAYERTDEEIRTTAELLEVKLGDALVLNSIEQGSPSNLYRYLGVKWFLTPFTMPALMPDRDWVVLESSGAAIDTTGRRYGYHTLRTVELPECPVFPGVHRGSMWYTFIYRDAGRGMLDMYSQGYFDCKGGLLDPSTVVSSTHMIHRIGRHIQSAEAKKLSIIAQDNLARKHAICQSLATTKPSVPANASCSICCKTGSTNPFSSRRLRICRACDDIVCSNCRLKKKILVGRQRVPSRVSVCHKCIVHARELVVNPAHDKYKIASELRCFDSATSHFQTRVSQPANDSSEYSTLSASGQCSTSSSDCSGDYSHQIEETFASGSLEDQASKEVLRHEEAYTNAMIVPPVRSHPRASPRQFAPPSAERHMLMDQMRQLQQAARRAQELTLASHQEMIKTSAILD